MTRAHMHMCGCKHMCAHVRLSHAYLCTCICAHTHIRVRTHTRKWVFAYECVRIQACVCACTCERANALAYVCMQCVCARTRMCVPMHPQASACDIWCEQTCICKHASTGACPCAYLHMHLHVHAYHVFGYTSMCATVPYVSTKQPCACMFAPMCTYQCVPAHCHICIRTLMHLQEHACVCTRTQANAYARTHVQCCANLHKCMRAQAPARGCIRHHASVHTCMRMHIPSHLYN